MNPIILDESQRMALLSIVAYYMRLKDQPQDFVDVVRDVTTTTGELLDLLMIEGR